MSRPRMAISPKDKAMYYFICNYFDLHHRVPTIRTLIDEGFSTSTSAVNWTLGRLIKLDLIERDERFKAAGYKIVGAKIKLPQAYYDILEAGVPILVRSDERDNQIER